MARRQDNVHDLQAIAVSNGAGQLLGFLPKALSALLSPAIDRGDLALKGACCLRWCRDYGGGSCVLQVCVASRAPLPPGVEAFVIAPPPPKKRKQASR